MPDLTPKGVPYANPADPNDLTLHTQGLADWIDANPGVAPLTTAQRDALTGAALWNGRVILNLTTGRLERYDAGASVWRSASVSDHGELAGLADDDHPQYLNALRHDTTARHGASVVDHGSIGGLSDDDHPQYALADGSRGAFASPGHTHAGMAQAASGSYTGDGANPLRTILVGFTPDHVEIHSAYGSSLEMWSCVAGHPFAIRHYATGHQSKTNIGIVAGGFTVSGYDANTSGYNYNWIAVKG